MDIEGIWGGWKLGWAENRGQGRNLIHAAFVEFLVSIASNAGLICTTLLSRHPKSGTAWFTYANLGSTKIVGETTRDSLSQEILGPPRFLRDNLSPYTNY